jgi:hypothetical protein
LGRNCVIGFALPQKGFATGMNRCGKLLSNGCRLDPFGALRARGLQGIVKGYPQRLNLTGLGGLSTGDQALNSARKCYIGPLYRAASTSAGLSLDAYINIDSVPFGIISCLQSELSQVAGSLHVHRLSQIRAVARLLIIHYPQAFVLLLPILANLILGLL